MVRTQLVIDGMTCENCVRHVGDALRAVPGVASASVTLADKRAIVDHESTVSAQALVEAIDAEGYTARIP